MTGRGSAAIVDGAASSIGKAAQFLLEDEIKYVTVLFSDIVGSTALVADISRRGAVSPHAAVTLMSEAILGFGGTINKILGDGVLAFFGAPTSQEDHALRACCAAQCMHKAASSSVLPLAYASAWLRDRRS